MLEIVLISAFGICFVAFIIQDVLFSLDNHSNSKFFCNVLKWHKDPKCQESDGVNFFGECPRCHKTIYQDKRGNWNAKK